MDTAIDRVTAIVGADIAVVAILGPLTMALALDANVGESANVVIVARSGIELVDTAKHGVTGVVGADVAIVAVFDLPGTGAVGADVALGAGVAVIAGGCIGDTHTTCLRRTGIIRTHVVVVAIHREPRHANTTIAMVAAGTEVLVVARSRVGLVHAALRRVAAIVSAGVAVVAGERRTVLALPSATDVSDRANVAVLARLGVGRVHAANPRLAAIVRAGVAVVAVGGGAGQANALLAGIAHGAGVIIVAGVALVVFGE